MAERQNQFPSQPLAVLVFCLFFVNVAGPGQGAEVGIRSRGENHFEIQSGPYRIHYDADRTNGRIILGRAESHQSLFLDFGLDALAILSQRNFKELAVAETDPHIDAVILSRVRWADFQTYLRIFKDKPGLLNWKLVLQAPAGLAKEIWRMAGTVQPELGFYDATAQKSISCAGVNYLAGTPAGQSAASTHDYCGGTCFFHAGEGIGSTVFYHADLSSMNAYYESTHTSAERTVRTEPWKTTRPDGLSFITRFGHVLPLPQKNLPAGACLTLADSYLYLWPEERSRPEQYMKLFLQLLAEVYDRIDKPDTTYTEWRDVAPQTIAAILEPGNWKVVGQQRYVQAFTHDQRAGADNLVLGNLLGPLKGYVDKYGGAPARELAGRLEARVPDFYQPEFFEGSGAIGCHPPPLADTWHPWASMYPYTQAGDLALGGNTNAAAMLKGSCQLVVQFARGMDYRFPFLANVKTKQPVAGPVNGYMYDVAGEYVYLMLQCYTLTGQQSYLDEAKKAAEKIGRNGFEYAYELGVTAMGAEACAWLYEVTGDPQYLELSYIPLANLIRHSWLWECDYGYAKSYPTFLGTSATPTCPFFCGHEEQWILKAMAHYYKRAGDKMPVYVRKLVAEMLKYKIAVARSTLPPFLPAEAVHATPHPGGLQSPYVGVNNRAWYVPLEGINLGWEKSGQTGQQIYGAGLPILLADLAYQVFKDKDIGRVTLYAEYPVVRAWWKGSESELKDQDPFIAGWWNSGGRKYELRFEAGGAPEYAFEARVFYEPKLRGACVFQADNHGKTHFVYSEVTDKAIQFRGRGGMSYRVFAEMQ